MRGGSVGGRLPQVPGQTKSPGAEPGAVTDAAFYVRRRRLSRGGHRDVTRTLEQAEATDDASLVEAAGGSVTVVEAPRENLKVTTALDLQVAEAILAARC